ncbi:G2/mitotic-specific cyclin-B2 [Pelomyxa schiedti]|nr:G2/mitotic-specific cyclin-B2 [Pelomyxa schiedti]
MYVLAQPSRVHTTITMRPTVLQDENTRSLEVKKSMHIKSNPMIVLPAHPPVQMMPPRAQQQTVLQQIPVTNTLHQQQQPIAAKRPLVYTGPEYRFTSESAPAAKKPNAVSVATVNHAAPIIAPSGIAPVPQQPQPQQQQQAQSHTGVQISEQEMHLTYVDPVVDIDLGDNCDPIFVTDYVREVFENCRDKEVQERLNACYLQMYHRQEQNMRLNEKMREILVDWMAEVCIKFKLLSETFFLAVYIVDKYLGEVMVSRTELQLVGITSILIASKFEEIYAVEVGDLIYISDHAYDRAQILKCECTILDRLHFQLSVLSPLFFLRRYSKASLADPVSHTFSKYLVEMSTMDYSLLAYLPSQIAAAAVYLTRRTTHLQNWTSTLAYYSKYSEEDIVPVARKLHACVLKYSSSYQSIKTKYMSDRHSSVASMPLCKNF